MIGIFSYTVILTYLSLLSAGTGIVVSLAGGGHPYFGCFFLLFCGLCDAFDGKVARTKKNRTKAEMNFGIQIDTLSDIVAFGVLPACIGAALIRTSPVITALFNRVPVANVWIIRVILYSVLVLYILAAMIRLAWYNVTEMERQENETGERKFYTGLPVTAASLIFPLVLLFQYILPADITLVYIFVAFITAFLFVCRFQLRKPGLRGILIMIGIGVVEFALLLIWKSLTGNF